MLLIHVLTLYQNFIKLPIVDLKKIQFSMKKNAIEKAFLAIWPKKEMDGYSMEWLTFGPNFMILVIQKSSQTQKMHFSDILAGKPQF